MLHRSTLSFALLILIAACSGPPAPEQRAEVVEHDQAGANLAEKFGKLIVERREHRLRAVATLAMEEVHQGVFHRGLAVDVVGGGGRL